VAEDDISRPGNNSTGMWPDYKETDHLLVTDLSTINH